MKLSNSPRGSLRMAGIAALVSVLGAASASAADQRLVDGCVAKEVRMYDEAPTDKDKEKITELCRQRIDVLSLPAPLLQIVYETGEPILYIDWSTQNGKQRPSWYVGIQIFLSDGHFSIPPEMSRISLTSDEVSELLKLKNISHALLDGGEEEEFGASPDLVSIRAKVKGEAPAKVTGRKNG